MKIAILSRKTSLYSTRRLKEAAEKRGHEVIVVDYLKCSLVNEHKTPTIFYKGELLEEVEAIIPRIGASATFYGTAVVRQFELMNVFSVNSSVAIARSRDKLRSQQIFSSHDIGIPKTVFAKYTKDTDSIIKAIGGAPVIIKLLEGTQGIGVVLAETKKAAKSTIEAFNGLKANILIQEFIKEAGGADIRTFIINGKVIGAMKRQNHGDDFRSNIHRGGDATPVKITRIQRELALRAAKAMGLRVCGVDMIMSDRGPLVLEVNSSPGLEGIEGATGKDIAGSVIEFIESQKDRHLRRDSIGV